MDGNRDIQELESLAGFSSAQQSLLDPGDLPAQADLPWYRRPLPKLLVVAVAGFVPLYAVTTSVDRRTTASQDLQAEAVVAAPLPTPSQPSRAELIEQNLLMQQQIDRLNAEVTQVEEPEAAEPAAAEPLPEGDRLPTPEVEVASPEAVDGSRRWQVASKVGSFGSIPDDSATRARPEDNPSGAPALAATVMQSSPSQIAQAVQPDVEGEQFILHGRISTRINAGTTVRGVLQTDAFWVPESDADLSFSIATQEPVVDSRGVVAYPSGTLLLSRIQSVGENGLVQMEATQAITPTGQTHDLEGVSIRGEAGQPLIAQMSRDVGGDIASMDLGVAALGGIQGAASELTRSISESAFSSSTVFGSTTSTSIDNGNRNPVAGFFEGAAGAILPEIQQRNRDAIAKIQATDPIWLLPTDRSVLVSFDRPQAL